MLSQAACSPAAYSLISDYVVVMNHAKALSIYHFATNVGIAAAFGLGLLNFYLCWRWVFFSLAIAGGCGFLLIVIVLREPPYDSSDSLMSSQDLYTVTVTSKFWDFIGLCRAVIVFLLFPSVAHYSNLNLIQVLFEMSKLDTIFYKTVFY